MDWCINFDEEPTDFEYYDGEGPYTSPLKGMVHLGMLRAARYVSIYNCTDLKCCVNMDSFDHINVHT